MSSALFQPQHFGRAWLGAVVTGPTKRNQVFNRVGLGDTPRDDVVNVEPSALFRERAFFSSALAARVTVARSDLFGHIFPVRSTPVMLGRSPLPLWVFLLGFADNVSRYVAFVRAKAPRFASETAKTFAATIASQNLGFFAIPSCAVIAGHIAKAPSVSVVSVNLKGRATSLTNLFGPGFGLLTLASPRAIGATAAPPEGFTALFAIFSNIFHVWNISQKRREIKYFKIACKRVEEAYRQPDMFVPAPAGAVQTALFDDKETSE